MKPNWSLVMSAAVSLLCLVITSFCVPLLKAKLSAERYAALQQWISIAVQAAEQLFGSGTGKQKKDYVLSFLLNKGLVYDVDDVTALVESEVYELKK